MCMYLFLSQINVSAKNGMVKDSQFLLQVNINIFRVSTLTQTGRFTVKREDKWVYLQKLVLETFWAAEKV